MSKKEPAITERIGKVLSRSMSFADRALFVRFAKRATVGHWAEVVDVMEKELSREYRDQVSGEPLK